MGGIDFVIAIRADHQEVVHIRLGQQFGKHIKCGRIEPLQIVQEQGERMFASGEDANEPPDYQLEEAVRVQEWQLGNGRLFADEELELGDEIGHKSAVRA